MSVSPYIRDLICCKQTSTEEAEFDRQAYLVFTNSEQGYVDVQVDHDRKARLGEASVSTLGAAKQPLAGRAVRTDDAANRLHTIEQLQDVLGVSQSDNLSLRHKADVKSKALGRPSRCM